MRFHCARCVTELADQHARLEQFKVLNTLDVREQLNKHGLTPQPSTREELARYMASESAAWGRIIRERKITAE